MSESSKPKKKVKEAENHQSVEGIIYKVGKDKLVLAVDEKKEVDLPERVRLQVELTIW